MNLIKLILIDWDQYLKLNTGNKLKKILLFFPVFFNNPGMLFSLIYRIENALYYGKYFKIVYWLFYPLYFIITYYILDIEIHPGAKIGYGLYLHNRGINIACDTEIGNYSKIMGPITIGISFSKKGNAKIGNNIIISTGARIIGPVNIGDNVIIGANAVVCKDFQSNLVIGGIPAVIIKNNQL
jgi:serine O-acetyltransferase